MRLVRTTITIEHCRETVIEAVLSSERAGHVSAKRVYTEGNEQAEPTGSIIDVSPVIKDTAAEKLIP